MTNIVAIPAELRARMSEADWQDMVIEYAQWHRWHVAHFRPALTQHGWRTPMQGDKGFPDLVLARDGAVLFVELKREREKPDQYQIGWLTAIGAKARVWRPRDWPVVQKELA